MCVRFDRREDETLDETLVINMCSLLHEAALVHCRKKGKNMDESLLCCTGFKIINSIKLLICNYLMEMQTPFNIIVQ